MSPEILLILAVTSKLRLSKTVAIFLAVSLLCMVASVFLLGIPSERQQQSKQTEVDVWAPASKNFPGTLQMNVTCAAQAGGDGSGSLGLCGQMRRSNRCARFLSDAAIPMEHVEELKSMLSWLISEAWGAGTGPPSVVDLHGETISYKEQFVNLTELMNFKSLKFTQKQVEAYTSVRRLLRLQVADLFGLEAEHLQHDMTFFSHINGSKTARTLHDEYWHSHIDTEQYGTFAFTTLLYLNSQDEDFHGGEFVFEAQGTLAPAAVEPKAGRIVAFSSDAENPHKVLKVTQGIRMALTAAFTCSTEKALSIEAFPKPSLVASG
eukprot:s325_g7.t1